MGLLQIDPDGLWCEAGGFHVDPWGAVPRALITHGHSDHARTGSDAYLCSDLCAPVLRERLGPDIRLESLPYGEPLRMGPVTVSFHPAGHVLGSAQIRVEHRGEVWVVSGDYKLTRDTTCTPFEPVRCQTFVTESTFGLPIYRWPEQGVVMASISEWWRANRERGKCSVIFAYPLGKSQSVLAGVDPENGPIFCHGAVERMNRVYRASGVALPPTLWPGDTARGFDWTRALIVAPPSAQGSPWMKRFGSVSTAFVSGWMRIRGTRRRKSIDRGFVLSDHADWPGLQKAIQDTGAPRVLVTHGYRAPMVRWLTERGLEAAALETRFEGEREEVEDAVTESE
ncbi:MAG: ligase-associated DNA damage response exonuclease [Acidobacteriota bacterium]|nr:ligase-associated DNA damage response exonuclease [Acidobacteriota bacterium]